MGQSKKRQEQEKREEREYVGELLAEIELRERNVRAQLVARFHETKTLDKVGPGWLEAECSRLASLTFTMEVRDLLAESIDTAARVREELEQLNEPVDEPVDNHGRPAAFLVKPHLPDFDGPGTVDLDGLDGLNDGPA